jgi:outer membrane lipopolysaccharide assembly protein LptE/RlpB
MKKEKRQGAGLLALTIMAAAGLGACGYAGQMSFPNTLQRIYLVTGDSGIPRPGLQTTFTNALTQRLLSAGGRIVNEETQADTTITAKITSLENNPVAFDTRDIARRFRVVVTVNLQVIQRKGKAELVKEDVRGEAYYSAPSGITGIQTAEEDAIRRALREVAERVVTRVVENLYF